MIFLVLVSYIPSVLTVEVPGQRAEAVILSPQPLEPLTLISSIPGSHVLYHMLR